MAARKEHFLSKKEEKVADEDEGPGSNLHRIGFGGDKNDEGEGTH